MSERRSDESPPVGMAHAVMLANLGGTAIVLDGAAWGLWWLRPRTEREPRALTVTAQELRDYLDSAAATRSPEPEPDPASLELTVQLETLGVLLCERLERREQEQAGQIAKHPYWNGEHPESRVHSGSDPDEYVDSVLSLMADCREAKPRQGAEQRIVSAGPGAGRFPGAARFLNHSGKVGIATLAEPLHPVLPPQLCGLSSERYDDLRLILLTTLPEQAFGPEFARQVAASPVVTGLIGNTYSVTPSPL